MQEYTCYNKDKLLTVQYPESTKNLKYKNIN